MFCNFDFSLDPSIESCCKSISRKISDTLRSACTVEIRKFLSRVCFANYWKKFPWKQLLRELYNKNGFTNGPLWYIWRKFAQVWPIWSYRERFLQVDKIHWNIRNPLNPWKVISIQTLLNLVLDFEAMGLSIWKNFNSGK